MNNYKYNFNTIYPHALDMYNLDIQSNEYETVALSAWEKIGNKQYKLYHFRDTPEKIAEHTWAIKLPCNVDVIEAVTADWEDSQKTSSVYNHPEHHSQYVEQYIESRKHNTNPLYLSGKYIKYRLEDNHLILDSYFPNVNILYKGYVADEEGLPYLTEKELEAIVAYCAYISDLKEARITRDKSTMELALYMEQKWKKACTQARIPDYINQNEFDEILNVSSSWDRKRFGKSFKPIR